MMTAVLDARDLYRFFHAGDDETLALRGVSLSVEAGWPSSGRRAAPVSSLSSPSKASRPSP